MDLVDKPLKRNKDKTLIEMVKNCQYSDFSSRWQVYSCEVIPAILSSGIQCQFLLEDYKKNLPKECPYKNL